jgi:hypothetical protein
MKYSFDSRVRYSEIGEDKKLTLNSIINYFQNQQEWEWNFWRTSSRSGCFQRGKL